MAKKSAFACSECGYESPKWLGKCPSCSAWNTFKEVHLGKNTKSSAAVRLQNSQPQAIHTIETRKKELFQTGISEWDRVLGGMVQGQAVLLSGEPGMGKSTLLLQIADMLSQKGDVLYVNGEESSGQVKLRAERLGIKTENLFLFGETDLDQILSAIEEHQPLFLIIDSLQTLSSESVESSPGSLPQLRECTNQVVRLCKSMNIMSILVSHVNKDGQIAGPKAIEHLVDTVLFLESDARRVYRVLRSFKNRFGSTDEAGFFEMLSNGLMPADDLTRAFVSIHEEPVFGSALFAHSEGQRVFPLEVQALCHHTNQNYPRRTAEGIDNSRLSLLAAVVEKQLKIPLSKFDIYANVTGGLDIEDRAADLSVVAAICSSFKEKPLNDKKIFIGEVGLTGEIRPVSGIEKRVKESMRLGIAEIYIPYAQTQKINAKEFPVKPVRHISELVTMIL